MANLEKESMTKLDGAKAWADSKDDAFKDFRSANHNEIKVATRHGATNMQDINMCFGVDGKNGFPDLKICVSVDAKPGSGGNDGIEKPTKPVKPSSVYDLSNEAQRNDASESTSNQRSEAIKNRN